MPQTKNQKHFVFIIGTRAQLIKVAPVIVECEKRNIPCTLLMTGQHLETMHDLLDEFGVTSQQLTATSPKEHATVLSLVTWLPRAYRGLIKHLKAQALETNRINVLVHGDTLSTVLGALAGRQTGACVVHLESGLTSKKLFDPFPEELSRRIVFRLSNVAMCPDLETLQHMRLNYPKCQSIDTRGNTILDAIHLTGVRRSIHGQEPDYIVVSIHRFQNIYEKKRLIELVKLLENIANSHQVFFVLHPATRNRLAKAGLFERLESHTRIELLPRLGYSDFLRLAAKSACVLTDGGSNQEELAALGVPTIIMRQTTERSDGLGRNAVMEGSLSSGVLSYIYNKEYKTLEKNSHNTERESPSNRIINHLTKI